jgi:hypothetical protein
MLKLDIFFWHFGSPVLKLCNKAKDYLRFSVHYRDWRSCCASKKSDKAESAEGRSSLLAFWERAEEIIQVRCCIFKLLQLHMFLKLFYYLKL